MQHDYTSNEYAWVDMRNKNYRRAMTEFLTSYLEVPEAGFAPDGTLRRSIILKAFAMLIANDVFSDYNDLNREAIKDYGIVIPRAWVNGESGCGG